MRYLGIDLGGTNIKAALVDQDGRILAEAHRPTGLPRPAEAVCGDIAAAAEELLSTAGSAEVAAVGVGCPGTVDGATGTVLYSNNLGWHDFPLRAWLEQRLHLPVSIVNDANAAALGEAAAGCAKGADSAVILTLGTGVGGGVVLRQHLLTGYTGAASEPGHMVVVADGAPCSCGRCGCLEAYASATALIRATREAMDLHPDSLLHQLARAEGGVSGRTAFDAAEQGDPAGAQVVAQYVHYLAIGIADLINVFFPEVIGLSGGVANQGEPLLEALRREVEPAVFGHRYARKKTRLVCCTLGYRAGVIGAAMLAKQDLEQGDTAVCLS